MEITKDEIIAAMVESGMSIDEAEKEYALQYEAGETGAPKIPFPLAKINSSQYLVSKGVPLGALVWDAQRDENKRVIGFKEIHAFEDIDFVIISKNTAYSHWSQEEKKVLAKTLLGSPYQAATKYQDVDSGRWLKVKKDRTGRQIKYLEATKDLPELKMGYQLFVTVGIKPTGSTAPFTYINMFLKTVMLWGINKLSDSVATNDNNALKVLNIVTGEAFNGENPHTIVDLNNSTASLLPVEAFRANLPSILASRTAHREYVEAINAFYIKGSDFLGKKEEKEESSLPE